MRSFVVSLICLILVAPAFGYTVNAVKVDSGNITATSNVGSSVSADTVKINYNLPARTLGNSLSIFSVYVVPSRNNTGEVWLGDSTVDINRGFLLVSGTNVKIETNNLSNIYITGNTVGQEVHFITSNQ